MCACAFGRWSGVWGGMQSPRSAYDKYNRPGWLLLDLPNEYGWTQQQVNLVERMTDVNQGVLSGRYSGVRHQAA